MENTTKPKQRVGFQKGKSGNPAGRPRGVADWRAKNRKMLESELPDLILTVVEQAKGGDMVAMKLVLDRVLPPLKSESRKAENFAMPEGTVREQINAIATAILDGRLPSETGLAVANMLLRSESAQAEQAESYEDALKALLAQDEQEAA